MGAADGVTYHVALPRALETPEGRTDNTIPHVRGGLLDRSALCSPSLSAVLAKTAVAGKGGTLG